jgi:flagellar biosynthesis protein FlhA
MKLKDASVPVIFVAIILTFILPVPAFILDVLLAVNIIISAIILLNTVYLKEPLELSIFPSLVVVTTVYRLSLNVTSSKLILGKGEAGQVIEGFGRFVGQDNLVVGFIMFLIIMVVNFLVITKGSERVAEVAARFTLDAMPGKQMAIDADLNSGLISEKEAKDRRLKIQREADFYGAMDGASKFVKNDAIAGIVITILNIVGGLIIGLVMRGEELSVALENYTILTIGDGLVSQIPALMVSAATSFIVTRAASDSNISNDMLKQVFTNYRVMIIAAVLSFILSFFLVRIPFLLLAAILGFIGYTLKNQEKDVEKKEEERLEQSEVEEIRKPENVVSLLHVDPIELEFGYAIIPLADVNQGGDLLDRVVMIRRQLALELGMIVPIIRLRDNIQLNPNDYTIKIKGVEISHGEIVPDHYLAMNPGLVEEEIDGIETTEPAFGLPAIWIKEEQRDKAEMSGYTVVDPPSVIATHLTEVVKKHANELLGRQEVQTLIDNIKESHPAVVDELMPKIMTIGEVQKILGNLLKEGVSIRDMVTILETLADHAPVTHDPDILTEYVRQALGRSISKKIFVNEKTNVITIDSELEQLIMDSVQKTETGSYINIKPDVINNIVKSISIHIKKLTELGKQPIILTSPIVRLYLKKITEEVLPELVILSYNEVDRNIEVESVGMVKI